MNESNLSDEALAELLTLAVEVDLHGSIKYRNQQGLLHRIHGPAVIYKGGTKSWWVEGNRYRTEGPDYSYVP